MLDLTKLAAKKITELKIYQYKLYKLKNKKKKENGENEQSLRKMWDTIKHTNVCVMEIPEREELEKTKYLEETDSLDRLITRDYREISNKK